MIDLTEGSLVFGCQSSTQLPVPIGPVPKGVSPTRTGQRGTAMAKNYAKQKRRRLYFLFCLVVFLAFFLLWSQRLTRYHFRVHNASRRWHQA